MATINSLSSLSAKTGIGGLVSGMDIDELVKKLTQTSRNKITKQQQSVQRLEWKQTGYRSISKELKKLQSTYLDFTSAVDLRNKKYYTTTSATSSSDTIVGAVSTANASAGTMTVDSITQLATYQAVQSADSVSKALTGKMESAVAGEMTATDIDNLLAKISGKTVAIDLDGKVKLISFGADFVNSVNSNKTPAGLQTAFQDTIDKAFGVTNPADRILSVNVTNDQLTFSAPGSKVTLMPVSDPDTWSVLGFQNEQSNKINTWTSAKDLSLKTPLSSVDTFAFTINNASFSFKRTDSLSTIINKINSTTEAGVTITYTSTTDKFMVTARESGAGQHIAISDINGNLMTALGLTGAGSKVIEEGKNAIFSVNGQSMVRSSNTFDVDGVTLTLKNTTAAPVTITTKDDATSLTSTIKKFVDDYNSMIEKVNGLVKEKVYNDYPPLTDEQKSEMTESQIEKWEEKAKSGLLRGDALLRGLSSKLNSVMIGTSFNGTSLYNIGIISQDYAENGKLKVDETALKKALESRGSEIKELFTSEDGIATKLNSVITGAVKTSGVKGTRGTLIEMAGYDSTISDTENSITDKISSANKNIKSLQSRLISEEKRLWNKFTAMEKAIQSLNSQSSYLTQFTSK